VKGGTPAGTTTLRGLNLDVPVATGQNVVLSLSFRRAAETTFGPTPLTFENAEATTASAPMAR